jgi:HSP20 family protein
MAKAFIELNARTVRSFSLPDTVDGDKVRADFKNGVLTITLPKKEVAKPKTINVEISQ